MLQYFCAIFVVLSQREKMSGGGGGPWVREVPRHHGCSLYSSIEAPPGGTFVPLKGHGVRNLPSDFTSPPSVGSLVVSRFQHTGEVNQCFGLINILLMRRACLCLVIVYLETGSARKEMKRRGKPVMMPSRVEGLQDDGKVKIRYLIDGTEDYKTRK